MDTETAAIVLLALLLAGANGANDISKGIATIMGSGVTDARRALIWGTVCTVAGGIAAMVFGSTLIKTFSEGYLSDHFMVTREFLASTLIGAIAWIMISTWKGWPVSTTHALLGGLAGSVLYAAGLAGLNTDAVTEKALLPMLLSPLLAILVCWLVFSASTFLRGFRIRPVRARKAPADPRIADTFHWLSGGAISFARGLNDVPKIAAILFLALRLSTKTSIAQFSNDFRIPIVLVTVAMVAGGLWMGQHVLDTLAFRVAPLDRSTGTIANGATATLVLLASNFGLPVSTTHVSVGSLIGVRVGLRSKPGRKDSIVAILWAWIVTLPVAAILSALCLNFLMA